MCSRSDFCSLSRSTGSSSCGYGRFLLGLRRQECTCRIARNVLRHFALPRLKHEALKVVAIVSGA